LEVLATSDKPIKKILTSKGIPFKKFKRKDLDFTKIKTLFKAPRIDTLEFLINAAGHTGKPNVDACENDKTNCLFGHTLLPRRIAEAGKSNCARYLKVIIERNRMLIFS
tara:strand:- start:8860 stop:9186 length:327 start_codon:yes stop_codon:yes gene_type:complete